MGFECYRIGDLILDVGTQEVTRNGMVVRVPKLSFKLLLSLARHAPNVVSAEQLEKEVWEGLVVDRGTVNKRVLLLRKALSEGDGDDPYIAVIRGSGYRLITQVERVRHSPGEAGGEDDGHHKPAQQNSGRLRTASYWLLGLVTLLVLYNGFQAISSKNVDSDAAEPIAAGTQFQPVKYDRTAVAVLPFIDLSEGQNHQFFGDGIAEELINLLAAMDGLNVAARTSSFAFRDTTLTAMEIAPKLRVGTILEGSIRQSAERIRVAAQLIDTQTGYHIWSHNYDRSLDEIFEVQDDIALNIARALKLTLDESNQLDSGKAITGDIEAFALYLKGRELFNDRIQLRTEGLRKALEYFSEAVEQDPEFARAQAGIALVSWLLPYYDDSLDKETYFQRAEVSAKFALELDPRSTDALSSLASIHAARGNVEKAVTLFEQIHVIGSNDSNIAHWEAMLRIRLGYFDELIEPLTRVYRLDPFNEHIGWSLAAALNFSGDPEAAASILKELQHFTYRRYVLGLCAINNKNFSEAREFLRDTRMRSGLLPAAYADLLVDALEDPAKVEETAHTFVTAVEKGDLTNLTGFEALLVLGSPRVFDLGIDPLGDITRLQIHAQVWNNWAVAVRQDPRFKEWVKTLGYVSFWRKYGWPDRCRSTGLGNFECI